MTKQTPRRFASMCALSGKVLILATLTLSFSMVSIAEGKALSIETAEQQPAESVMDQVKAAAEKVEAATAKAETEEKKETWRKTVVHLKRPKRGCFVATYPETEWREVACKTPPHKLYPPKRRGGVRTEIVGGAGPDFSAVVTGHITEAEGSFDSVSVTSEFTVPCPGQVCPANPAFNSSTANEYSLQLNSKPFTTQTCSGSKPVTGETCQGWEQFVYEGSGGGFIQYWLENYGPAGTACPAPKGSDCALGVDSDGWCPFQFATGDPVYCVVNAANMVAASSELITNLQEIKLEGSAAGVNGADDGVIVSEANSSSSPFTTNGNNYFPDLGSTWQEVEFNVFGDGGGDQAVFNSGATVHVRTGVVSGTGLGPSCDLQSFTGESNNLTLGNTPPAAVIGTPPMPALLFWESDPAATGGAATCADATSVGDTHLTTFDGLHYDFQASGDFVLLQDGSDFAVHTRQASGAPTWPNAAVNKAVAVQMGKTRVAVYIEPTRLLIDGRAENLADGKTTLLPTGVQVTRHGDVYVISNENGDRVRATLNSTWIDVIAGLGHSERDTRGLLGNPKGNAHELATSKGVVLKEPVSFADLYHAYADSWRVQGTESLFTEATKIKPGIPKKPVYAKDLKPAVSAHATEICKAAGITNQDLLDDCILDNTVLKDEKAVKVFVHAAPPRNVVKPVLHVTPAH